MLNDTKRCKKNRANNTRTEQFKRLKAARNISEVKNDCKYMARGGGRDVEEARQVWRMWMDLNENKRILRLYRDEGGGSKAAAAQGRCGMEDILVII